MWRSFPCDIRQLRLDTVLICGQSFRWRESEPGEWLGVIGNRVWRLKQDDIRVYYQVYESSENEQKHFLKKDGLKSQRTSVKEENLSDLINELECKQELLKDVHTSKLSKCCGCVVQESCMVTPDSDDIGSASLPHIELNPSSPSVDTVLKLEKTGSDPDTSGYVNILQDYFQLHVDLKNLYHQWCASDAYFKKIAADFWGVRMLRQDPAENLFSFICSSNNHISRISSMVEKLCEHYGRPITMVDGKMYHSFPSISSLAVSGVEESLRELGFGYRAKFIATSARYIIETHGEEWVTSLRQRSYEEAKTELMKLCGVGAKVADCVCLMSLDKPGALPVDTHVWQFAARYYLPKLQSAKSVTNKLYQEIGDYFRKLWGEYAGWAHSVLFTAELRHMQSKKSMSTQMEQEMPALKTEEKKVANHAKAKRSRAAHSPTNHTTRSKLKKAA